MVAAEFKTPAATIRIHDDCLGPVAEDSIARLERIVSRSYQRRLQNEAGGAVAAFRSEGGPEKI